jgi:hypothetical protein
MCARTETDVRESANDCTLASGEGHGSRGETLHLICTASPMSSSTERTVSGPQYVKVAHFVFCVDRALASYQSVQSIDYEGEERHFFSGV